jgi:hypothetical protein
MAGPLCLPACLSFHPLQIRENACLKCDSGGFPGQCRRAWTISAGQIKRILLGAQFIHDHPQGITGGVYLLPGKQSYGHSVVGQTHRLAFYHARKIN